MWGFMDYVTTLSGIILLLFTAFSYLTGLLSIVELCEEYPTKTKYIIKYCILVVILLHIILIPFNLFNIIPILVGIVNHISYYKLNIYYPVIQLRNIYCISSVILLIVSQALWYYTFRVSSNAYRPVQNNQYYNRYNQQQQYSQSIYVYNTAEIISFHLIYVWFIPLIYFLSATIGDTLPSTHIGDSNKQTNKQNNSVWRFNFKSMINIIKRKKDEILPTQNDSIINDNTHSNNNNNIFDTTSLERMYSQPTGSNDYTSSHTYNDNQQSIKRPTMPLPRPLSQPMFQQLQNNTAVNNNPTTAVYNPYQQQLYKRTSNQKKD